MGYLSEFKIPFVGLSIGVHQFNYAIEDQFFEHFENAVIQHGRLMVLLTLTKQETLLQLDFNINGVLHVVCDRCSGALDLPVEGQSQLIIKLGDEEKEISENMIMINRNSHEIDVAQFIYEYISLLLPQRIVHPDDAKGRSTCDKKTIHALEQFSQKPHAEDPRWEALKKLRLK